MSQNETSDTPTTEGTQDEGSAIVLASAQLIFTDKADGTMSIDALHSGEFDPLNQSHACLRAVTQFLPDICRPAGTEIGDNNTGYKMPITDADRYAAIRALAFLPDAERYALLTSAGTDPATPEEFDAFSDKLVQMGRTNPKPKEAAIIAETAPKLVGSDGKLLN
jgi:hypothetical protein